MKLKATKSDLSKVINWSSSRYNNRKKDDVIREILFLAEVGEDTEVVFGTGSYSERGHLGGWDYILKIENRVITLTERRNVDVVYTIEKPKKNKLYTGAKRIKVVGQRYDWHKEIIGKEFDVERERSDRFEFKVNLDGINKVMSIDKKLVEVVF